MLKQLSVAALVLPAQSLWAFCSDNQNHCNVTQLSAAIANYTYQEPDLMEISGPLYAVQLDHFRFRAGSMTLTEAKVAFNQGDYTSPFSGSIDDLDSYYVNVSHSWGRQLDNEMNNTLMYATAGLGYRYLENDSTGRFSSRGDFGYLRQSNYIYLPLSIRTHYQKQDWTFQTAIKFNWLIQGSQYSEVDGGVRKKQKSGYGLHLNLRAGKYYQHSSQWLLGPYLTYWNMAESEVESGRTSRWIEPKNDTVEAGLTLTYTF